MIVVSRTRFDFLNVIGRGGFGKVWKVFDKKFQKFYALKEISKVKVIDKKSINTIKYERELLCNLNHPLIINLHYSFQDYDNLYFVLDLLTGGDLRYQLGRHPRRFYNESQTKFFIACIIESLIYIHSKNIIHRDIKPENLIFDDKGYLHVTDFGIAKFSNNKNLNETSGTPGYMAPEVMRGLNHTGSVDYFAVGIITYELMLGKRPYTGKNRKEIKEQMMMKQVYLDNDTIPLNWSQESADFINRLLIRKDTNRLGYYNDYEIKRHPWFRDINFEDLLEGKIRAPFIPRKNYDNYDKKYCEEMEEIGIETNIRYDNYRNNERYAQIFEGFTFYNVDESQILYHEIYKKPSVKYVKNNSYFNSNNNYIINKSKTINLDYDYKRRINQKASHNRVPSANNTSIRTIHYSNGNDITTNKISDSRPDQSSLYVNNRRYSLKNPDNNYIMASPNRRGRITINNDDTNIDNNFRKYANHSFVETNYSKGKTIRRSYSSSNLYNNSYINVFNLLVNNVNNINNNNILLNNANNSLKNRPNYLQSPKSNIPINYNISNASKIPIDKKNKTTNYKNSINYNSNNYNNRINSGTSKISSFSYVDNENSLHSGIKNNDYNNNSFRYSNYSSYKNNKMNSIYKIEPIENEKKNYLIPDKYKNLRRNHSYSYVCYFRNDIPSNSIKKVVPINLNDKAISYKKEIIPNIKNNVNYNKNKKIEYLSNENKSNSSIYIDKYKIRNENIDKKENLNNKLEISKQSKSDKDNVGHAQNYQINIINNLDKRAPPPISQRNIFNNSELKKLNNSNTENNKENNIINVQKSPNIKEKNNTYKKIPIPFPLNQRIKKKKLVLEDENINRINTKLNNSNKNIDKIFSQYNSKSYYTINDKENIKSNIANNLSETLSQCNYQIPFENKKKVLNNNEFLGLKHKPNIIAIKINEKNFNEYQYLNNFDKYKKIKNNKTINKKKHINYNSKVIYPNMIKRKICNKYHTISTKETKNKSINNYNQNS